ncbi:hypothetical protein L208DRAFT_1370823 [Tricholoma matsutake]|nr:hypothetical protein L208DRAFT_1370823 [Tricholoma matsutake 945]
MCTGAKWKREIVPDHKFDFVDTREFTDNGFVMRMKYLWLYIIVLKSFLVYMLDIFSAVTMLSTKTWSNQIFSQCSTSDGCIPIPFQTGKWLFVGCIIFGFLLFAYESRKSKKIIASRDISYAFTNVMANHYYSLRSYDHFCFFEHISDSTKTSDDFAFFVFFAFKSWKRVLLSEAPRQTINALTLYAIYLSKRSVPGQWYDVSRYFVNSTLSASLLTVTTFCTVVVFAGSLLILIAAAICYVPLLCHIRGNLKEYCCHKVDKRIGAVIKRRQKQRLADAAKLAQKEARGDYSHLKNKRGEMIAKPLPQPTLPNLSVDDDVDDNMSINTRAPPPSTYTQDYYNYNSDKNSTVNVDYPPPMPAYNPYSTHQQPGSHTHFQQSSTSFPQDDQNYHQHPMYDEDNESTAHLAAAAAPFSQQPTYAVAPPYVHTAHGGGSGSYDPHHVYQGRARSIPDPSRRPSSGLAYDEAPEYSRYGAPPPTPLDNPYDHNGYPQQGFNAGGDGGYCRAL